MLVSATYQYESATDIPMSSPYWTLLPPPTPPHPQAVIELCIWAPCVIEQMPTGHLFYRR